MPSSESIASGYERAQPTLRAMVIFVICFAIAAVALHYILSALYGALLATDSHAPASPLSNTLRTAGYVITGEPGPLAQGPQVTPAPRLQPSGSRNESPLDHIDAAEMAAFRHKENTLLNSYSVNVMTGDIAIPIDQAMRLVLRHIPTQPDAPPHEAAPTDGGGFK